MIHEDAVVASFSAPHRFCVCVNGLRGISGRSGGGKGSALSPEEDTSRLTGQGGRAVNNATTAGGGDGGWQTPPGRVQARKSRRSAGPIGPRTSLAPPCTPRYSVSQPLLFTPRGGVI